jgi:hypothetical protein
MTHIGLMGTHGTGKSTYAQALLASAQDIFYGEGCVAIINEVARSCPYPVNRETTEEAQLWIFTKQMQKELEALCKAEYIICDRTILDGLAYAEAAGLTDMVDAFLPPALMWMERYTHIYWFRPVAGRLVADGFRDTDPAFQTEIDSILSYWVKAYHIPVKEFIPCCGPPLDNTT